MDAGSVNSSPSSSSSTSRYLKSQSRFPLQEQFLQRKKPRENVISYIFSFSFVYISVIALLFYPFVSIALFLVPSCFKFHFFTWVFYNLIFEIRFLRIENSDFCPKFQFLMIFFFFFHKKQAFNFKLFLSFSLNFSNEASLIDWLKNPFFWGVFEILNRCQFFYIDLLKHGMSSTLVF